MNFINSRWLLTSELGGAGLAAASQIDRFGIWDLGLKSRGRKNPVSEGNCVILAGKLIDLGFEIWDWGFKKKLKSALEQL